MIKRDNFLKFGINYQEEKRIEKENLEHKEVLEVETNKAAMEKINQRILLYGDEVLEESKDVRPLYPIIKTIEVYLNTFAYHKRTTFVYRNVKELSLIIGNQKGNGANAKHEKCRRIKRQSGTAEEKTRNPSRHLPETCSGRSNILFSVNTVCNKPC